ncbi:MULTISPECIES: hypothetical protein [Pseudomonas]|uniref:hypothetical protein n=1 Tax=Pseudomonas TaxID=286 RepID=UPI0007618377|nr:MULTISPECIES: hypothetical protein [Pseudomonas]MDG9809493.1 hypothetical protein [Pseudomonas juntendi]MDG9815739.1 hypothetical protein [Pseudomonas putida]
MAEAWVLQDSRNLVGDRLMFWALGGGYTSDLDKAERYTQDQAVAQNRSRESDLPWPLAYLEQRTETAVDCQYIKPEAVESGLQTTERSYMAAKGVWNGNDLYWLTDDGQVTANFAKAHAFPIGIARSMAKPTHHNVRAIPVALADSLARKVVPNGGVKIGIALRGTGVELAKPPRSRSRSMRCGHCGVFISQYQVADCPKCGGMNLP